MCTCSNDNDVDDDDCNDIKDKMANSLCVKCIEQHRTEKEKNQT